MFEMHLGGCELRKERKKKPSIYFGRARQNLDTFSDSGQIT